MPIECESTPYPTFHTPTPEYNQPPEFTSHTPTPVNNALSNIPCTMPLPPSYTEATVTAQVAMDEGFDSALSQLMALIDQTIEDFTVAHRQWENYRQYLKNDHAELMAQINQLEGELWVEWQTNANHICTIKWMARNVLQLEWSTAEL